MSNDTSMDLDQLVKQLSSDEMGARMQARESLVKIGSAAVPSICKLADSENDHLRWECAKTLSEFAEPASIDTLIRLLEDPDEGTRWDAAVGLIKIGPPAVEPLLQAIVRRSRAYTIIGGARHVMHEFCKPAWGASLQPVYQALNSFCARESAPVEAGKALDRWQYSELRD